MDEEFQIFYELVEEEGSEEETDNAVVERDRLNEQRKARTMRCHS